MPSEVSQAISGVDSREQTQTIPFETPEEPATWRQTVGEHGGDYPYLAEVAAELVRRDYDYSEEFEFSLGFILDGLERYRKTIRSWKRLR